MIKNALNRTDFRQILENEKYINYSRKYFIRIIRNFYDRKLKNVTSK